MTLIEYKELKELLYDGHDFEFKYDDKIYFLEKGEDCHKLYVLMMEECVLIHEIRANTIKDAVDLFLDKKIFDDNSFNVGASR